MARIQDLFVTVGILTKGQEPKILYVGTDAAAAQSAYDKADTRFDEVGVVAHPQCVFPRRPEEEARLSRQQKEEAENRKRAAENKLRNEASSKEEQAKKLMAESEQIRAEIAATQKPLAPVDK